LSSYSSALARRVSVPVRTTHPCRRGCRTDHRRRGHAPDRSHVHATSQAASTRSCPAAPSCRSNRSRSRIGWAFHTGTAQHWGPGGVLGRTGRGSCTYPRTPGRCSAVVRPAH
jgi:hypothetical protein